MCAYRGVCVCVSVGVHPWLGGHPWCVHCYSTFLKLYTVEPVSTLSQV